MEEEGVRISSIKRRSLWPSAQRMTLFLCIALLSFQLFKVFNTEVWRDDAIFAATAKNMLEGHGYGIALYDRFTLFHPGISSGPLIIFPAALAITLFGNQFWVPGLTSVLLIDVLLLLLYWRFKAIAPDVNARWTASAAFLASALVLTNAYVGFAGQPMLLWHALMGEVPSALLIIIAAFSLARSYSHPSTLFVSGLLVGLGMLCKLQAIWGGAALGISLLLVHWVGIRSGGSHFRLLLRSAVLFALGCFLPLILFEVWKMAAFPSIDSYIRSLAHLQGYVGQVNHTVMDVETVLARCYTLGQRFIALPKLLLVEHGLTCLVGVLVGVSVFLLLAYRQLRTLRTGWPTTPIAYVRSALLLACLLHITWCLFINRFYMPRYLTQGMLYGCAAFALVMYEHASLKPAIVRRWAIGLLCCVAVLRYDVFITYAKGFTQSPGLAEQQEAFSALTALKKQNPNTVFFSCGHTFEMEYLLPGVGNFVHCSKLSSRDYQTSAKVLVSFYIDDLKKLYNFAAGSLDWRLLTNPHEVTARCPHNDIYESAHYSIASCTM